MEEYVELSTQPGKNPVGIFDIRDLPSMDPRRPGKTDTMITYDIDPMHRYFITVPREEITMADGSYDEGKISAKIRQDMESRSKILGKQILV